MPINRNIATPLLLTPQANKTSNYYTCLASPYGQQYAHQSDHIWPPPSIQGRHCGYQGPLLPWHMRFVVPCQGLQKAITTSEMQDMI